MTARPGMPSYNCSILLVIATSSMTLNCISQNCLKFPSKIYQVLKFPTDWEGIGNGNQLVSALSNGYEVGYIGPKVLDVAFYPETIGRPTARDFVAFGDAKGNSWTGTSASGKGQVMMYGHRILDAQPQRSSSVCFCYEQLCSCYTSGRCTIPGLFLLLTFEYGMKIFFFIFCNRTVAISIIYPPSVMGNIIQIRQPLRPGGACRAFAA